MRALSSLLAARRYVSPFRWCCSCKFLQSTNICYSLLKSVTVCIGLLQSAHIYAIDQVFTCEACDRQLPPAAFTRNRSGVRYPLCRSCRPLRRGRRRLQQQRSPPNFQLILSQPADTYFCTSCQCYRPVADFCTNYISALYLTCTNYSTVHRCPLSLISFY